MLMLLFFSMFLFFLSGEVVIRFMVKDWPFKTALYLSTHLTARDQPLRWRFSSSDGRNSLGLRNREVNQKRDGVYRILFIGDSLIWSGETTSGKLYSAVLEHRLNSNYSNNTTSYEVVNAGIPGYTTYQELEFLKIYGLDMEPDLVVLGFVFNDLYYKYLHRPTKNNLLGNDPSARLHYFNTNSFPGTIFARSHLAHEIVRRSKTLWKRITQQHTFPFEQRGDFYLAWKDYGWIHTQKLIGMMQKLLANNGVPLRVLVFPVSDQVNDRYRRINKQYLLYPQSMINKISNSYEIPVLDLTDAIYKRGGITLYRDYLHLNGKGNDVVVDELQRYLVNEIGLNKSDIEIHRSNR